MRSTRRARVRRAGGDVFRKHSEQANCRWPGLRPRARAFARALRSLGMQLAYAIDVGVLRSRPVADGDALGPLRVARGGGRLRPRDAAMVTRGRQPEPLTTTPTNLPRAQAGGARQRGSTAECRRPSLPGLSRPARGL